MNNDIKKWLDVQHIWIQEAACRILAKATIDDSDISEFVEIIKKPDGKESSKSYPSLGKTDSKNIRLVSLGPVKGIDRLNPKKPLDFGKSNLVVVYGSNGSGKSGFVRILKKMCGKTNTSELQPNVYEPPPSNRSCIIKYSIGNEESSEKEWVINTPAIAELSNIDIFDARNGNIYLENETELSYLPPELTLFTNLVGLCGRVDKVLNDEKQKLVSALPAIPEKYKATSCSNEYNNLKYNTPQNNIDELLVSSIDGEDKISSLRQRLSISDPLESAKKQRAVKTQIDSIKLDIEKILESTNQNSLDKLRKELEGTIQKRKTANEGAAVLSSMVKLEGVGTETWRKLWQAAREYSISEAYKNKGFPYIEENARCPLCHQILDIETKDRLQNFEAYIQGKLESDARDAEKKFEEAINNLPNCPTDDVLKSRCQAAGFDDVTTDKITVFFINAQNIIENLKSRHIPENKTDSFQDIQELLEKISKLTDVVERTVEQLEKDAESFNRSEAESELLNLEAKKWVSEQRGAVKVEIERLKSIEQYAIWRKNTETAKITREASNISEKLITESYINRFNEELKKLGAASITVELIKARGDRGRIKHKIRLKNLVAAEVNIADILSDGEKRIVSLAAFLADVTGYNANTPFIFDDPISSLDQEYEEKTIERLVELSRERQVIIFTHRLSFLSIISDKVKKAELKQNIIHISKEPWGTGNPGDVPIFGRETKEALNKLKNDRLAQAKK
jgi:energy-coupling factor transporter ATP-binding protein EcfA2